MSDKEMIFNVITGEQTVIDLSPEKMKLRQELVELGAKKDAEIAAKEAARQAVIEKLGLTVEEATALLGL